MFPSIHPPCLNVNIPFRVLKISCVLMAGSEAAFPKWKCAGVTQRASVDANKASAMLQAGECMLVRIE